ncbi:FkbM family methyltransferase [Lacinutrix jangbogonensis]|uniref:FkbM family methyltransferase n=1 Tax=Lacinutrix jangbogonensis TaxID=1469557 RepID=UPI00053D9179|nr:FkbM family methyltransferase [Lacinutrix jangbogonensis]
MLAQLKTIKKLKGNFNFFDALKLFNGLKKEKETVYSNKRKRTLHFRKNTKDFETFEEVFITQIYNIDLTFTPKTIIDAGANTGFASLFFKFRYPDADIVAVEIDGGNAEMIEKNLKGFSNFEIIKKGLFNKHAFFKVENPYEATNSFVIKEVNQDDNYDVEAVTVSQIIKDKNWDTVDILKIDIEGAEMELFESNYQDWLPKVKVIYVETHDRMKPKCAYTVIKAINEFNDFILYTCTEGTLVFFNKALMKLP